VSLVHAAGVSCNSINTGTRWSRIDDEIGNRKEDEESGGKIEWIGKKGRSR
jgi:hypothetical protein